MFHLAVEWLRDYQFIAIWIEGLALVFIFILDWRERVDQGRERQRIEKDRQDQRKETAQQIKISEENAEAYLAQNRPWLLLDSDDAGMRIQPPHLVPVGTVPDDHLRMSHCIFFVKNFGNTAAKLRYRKAVLQIGDNPGSPPEISVTDSKDVGWQHETYRIIPPGQSEAIEADLSPQGIIGEKENKDVLERKRFLWLRCEIKYEHTIGNRPMLETNFCCLWETRTNATKPFWREAGGAEDNRAT